MLLWESGSYTKQAYSTQGLTIDVLYISLVFWGQDGKILLKKAVVEFDFLHA